MPSTPPADGVAPRADTREEILGAAQRIVATRGLSAATTRAIAEEAGCAEGSIYRHFADKHDLFIEVVRRGFPDYLDLMASLPGLAGSGSTRATLERVLTASLAFYRSILPMIGGAMADRELRLHQRRHFHATNTGPAVIIGSLRAYLEAEQHAGRLAAGPSAEHAARTLLGACFFQAHLEELLGEVARPRADEAFASETVRIVLGGMASGGTAGAQARSARSRPAASEKASSGASSSSSIGTNPS